MENTIDIAELDRLRDAYKAAVEEWITAIRREHAGFDEEEVRNNAMEARQAYEDALRKVDFNF